MKRSTEELQGLMTSSDNKNALPFVKWAGGKRNLIPEIKKRLPKTGISHYWEPFVGGGAVFFALNEEIEKAKLRDLNSELICAYKTIKKRPQKLIEALEKHSINHKGAEYFLKVRNQLPQGDIERTSRFLYLNRTCFNGLYRVNRAGKFNVPKGDYKNPMICNTTNIWSVHEVLKKAFFKIGQFHKTVTPKPDDFIYTDPPYDECFTSYQPGGFNKPDQKRLCEEVKKWVDLGAKVMISNSDTPYIRELYKNFKIKNVMASRNISCKGKTRGKIQEVLITTY